MSLVLGLGSFVVVGLGNGGHVFGAWFGAICCGRLREWGSCLWCLVWGRSLILTAVTNKLS